MDISVIIPSYNSGVFLENCITSLLEQESAAAFEIIVADSSDDPKEIDRVARLPNSVRLVRSEKRLHPGLARNLGASEARGSCLAFIDSDCQARPGWIQKIYERFQSGVKIFGGSVRNGYPNHPIATAEFFMEFGEFLPERKPGLVTLAPSCNFAIDKEIFLKVGGFPGHVTSEDELFCYFLDKKGYAIYYEPEMEVIHFNRRRFGRFIRKQQDLGYGGALVRKQYPVKGQFLVKMPILAWSLPVLRTILVWRKVLKNHLKYFPQLAVTSPLMIPGLIAYAYGFWLGHRIPSEEYIGTK